MDNKELADLLNALDPKTPLGTELHSAIIRLSPPIAIEAVAFREGERGTEVLLRKRGPNEAFPGQWHCPGSFIRSGEQLHDVFARLKEKESLGVVFRHELVDNHFWMDERGWICSAVYLLRVEEVGSGVEWHPVNQLPQPMVNGHETDIIPMAVKRYRQRISGT